MRDLKTFLKDITQKPIVLFPLIGLFHVLMFAYTLWVNIKGVFEPVDVAWILSFTFFWIFICDMRRWAAWGYLGLTMVDIILYSVYKSSPIEAIHYVSSILPLDVIFSFFVLFFYKRFQ